MKNNLSESKSKLKVSLIAIESYKENYGTDYEFTQNYGYKVYENHPLAQIREDEQKDISLYLGSYEVKNYNGADFECIIPVYYCVRTWSNDFYSFVCGLDLTADGRVWVGIGKDSYFNSVDEAMDFVQKQEGKECFIFTESKMML